ncbi:hypothetical protein JCM19000A_04790 [Silvimonas sp. JCM 19000]
MFSKQSPILKTPGNSISERHGVRTGSPGVYPAPPLSAEPFAAEASASSATSSPAAAASVAESPVTETRASTAEVSGSRLIVGPDVKLKGAEILDCDTLVVEGRVEATMDSRVIRIAEGGSFSGKVGIDVAEIYGVFEGELTARDQLIIHATGRVKGKIRYGKLLIESGGAISGEIETLSEARFNDERISNVKPLLSAAG